MGRKPLLPDRDRSGDRELSSWRWLAAALALALHGAAWMLLRTVPDLDPASTTAEPGRIRLTWSQREPEAAPPAKAPAPALQARRPRNVAVIPRAVQAPAADVAPPAAPMQLTLADDAWAVAPARSATAGQDADFRRPLFDDGQADAFAPERHLPGLRMRDASLGGRLATLARMADCGELAIALGRGGGTLVGGGHDPGRARPQGGEASSAAILDTMQRRGCR